MHFCPIKQYIESQSRANPSEAGMSILEKRMPFNIQLRRHRSLITPMLLMFSIIATLDVCAFFAQAQDANEPIRVRIFSMRNISAQQGKTYLADAHISDSAVVIPGTNAITVTAEPQHLIYASSVLKIVDSNEPFDVKFIDIDPSKKLPQNEAIQMKLDINSSVGTLLEGTAASAQIKLIVDKYEDRILIISPQSQTEKTIKIINDLIAEADKEAAEVKNTDSNTIPPSANDVNVSDVNVVNTVGKPVETPVEVNKPAEIKKQKTTDEDDMLGEFMTELADAAKADKEAKLKAEAEKAAKAADEVIAAKQEQPEFPAIEKTTAVSDGNLSKTEQQVVFSPEANEAVLKNKAAADVMVIPNGDEILELNLPEKLEIVTLIDLVGRYLNLNYLYDDTKITGSVTVKVQGKIRVRELYSLLESVLKFRGFAMSRKGNLVTIVPSADTLDLDPKLVDGGVQPGDVAVTRVFHLQYINTAAAKKLLTEMKLGSSITEISETGTLVITEYAFRMQRIEDLLKLVDVSGPPKGFKLRVLKYTIAESLVPKIKSLAEQLGTVEITIGTTSSTSASTAPAAAGGRPTRSVRTTPTAAQTTTESASKGVFIDFDKRTNRVLMIGLDSELAAVDKIIDSLDVPQQDLRVIHEYEIQYVDINKIVEALKELNIIDTAVGSTSTASTTGKRTVTRGSGENVTQPAAVTAALSGGESETAILDQPQVVMLETTNSLLVNATPEQHTQIQKIISYIDREPIQAAIPYRIYRLENQDPEELAETLNGLIEKTVQDKEGKIQQTVKYTEDNIVIVPDKNTFSLIVYASKKNQDWIGNLIHTLDTRRPQVLIDVSLVEVTSNDSFEYDLNIVANAKGLVTDNLQLTALNSSATGGNREASYNSTDGVKGFYSNERIQVLLTMLDSKGYGRVLAQPKVLVNDNEEGTIETTQKTYVKEDTTNTTADSLVTTSTTWKDYSASIKLTITPQISEGELLRLEIAMVREDFGDVSATGAPPDMTTSNVTTVVTVPDGSTIILGGLNKLNQSKSGTKVPVLGDIPVAGALFRSVDNSNTDRRLYIFVKANILRPDVAKGLKQLKDISKKSQVEFESYETRFQNHESFPGIKPDPVDPTHVLEQEANEPDLQTTIRTK